MGADPVSAPIESLVTRNLPMKPESQAKQIFSFYQRSECALAGPATKEQISAVELELGFGIPTSLRDLYALTSRIGRPDGNLVLVDLSHLVEFNRDFQQCAEHFDVSDLLCFSHDEGLRFIALNKKDGTPIVSLDPSLDERAVVLGTDLVAAYRALEEYRCRALGIGLQSWDEN